MAASAAATPNQPGVADSCCLPAIGANAVAGASSEMGFSSTYLGAETVSNLGDGIALGDGSASCTLAVT